MHFYAFGPAPLRPIVSRSYGSPIRVIEQELGLALLPPASPLWGIDAGNRVLFYTAK